MGKVKYKGDRMKNLEKPQKGQNSYLFLASHPRSSVVLVIKPP